MSLADLRKEYQQAALDEAAADPDPIRQFTRWFSQAAEVNEGPWFEPNAMTLCTASPDGVPSARVVLVKDVDERGLTFYTNYASQKGRELAANPVAAAVFYWPQLERQVRVAGPVARLGRDQSLAYFARRPRGSQLGAAASEQSAVIPGRDVLEQRLASLESAYAGRDVPMPEQWGGYVLAPREVEFWQGRANRLHDRLRYRRNEAGAWTIQRLSP